jgi:hypothetical protein
MPTLSGLWLLHQTLTEDGWMLGNANPDTYWWTREFVNYTRAGKKFVGFAVWKPSGMPNVRTDFVCLSDTHTGDSGTAGMYDYTNDRWTDGGTNKARFIYFGTTEQTVSQEFFDYWIANADEIEHFNIEITENNITRILDIKDKLCQKSILITPNVSIALQNKTVTSNGQVTADEGYDGLGTVTVNVPIPEGYIKPEGSLPITENGTYPVTDKEEVVVDVPTTTDGVPVEMLNQAVMNELIAPNSTKGEVGAVYLYHGEASDTYEYGTLYYLEEVSE